MRVSLGLLFLLSGLVFGQADHLVFSEVVLTPSDGEYVKITNPTENDIDMSDTILRMPRMVLGMRIIIFLQVQGIGAAQVLILSVGFLEVIH